LAVVKAARWNQTADTPKKFSREPSAIPLGTIQIAKETAQPFIKSMKTISETITKITDLVYRSKGGNYTQGISVCSNFVHKLIPKNERTKEFKFVVSDKPLENATQVFISTSTDAVVLKWGTNPKRLRGYTYLNLSEKFLQSFSKKDKESKNIPIWVKITPIKS
jgi:hypothetical protein